jgi:hypothetical protein
MLHRCRCLITPCCLVLSSLRGFDTGSLEGFCASVLPFVALLLLSDVSNPTATMAVKDFWQSWDVSRALQQMFFTGAGSV